MKSIDDYPDLLQVEDLLEITKVCRNTLYKILKTTQAFPIMKIGGKYMVPKRPFWVTIEKGNLR